MSDEMVKVIWLPGTITEVLGAVIIPFPLLDKQANGHQNHEYHKQNFKLPGPGRLKNEVQKEGTAQKDHCGL